MNIIVREGMHVIVMHVFAIACVHLIVSQSRNPCALLFTSPYKCHVDRLTLVSVLAVASIHVIVFQKVCV